MAKNPYGLVRADQLPLPDFSQAQSQGFVLSPTQAPALPSRRAYQRYNALMNGMYGFNAMPSAQSAFDALFMDSTPTDAEIDALADQGANEAVNFVQSLGYGEDALDDDALLAVGAEPYVNQIAAKMANERYDSQQPYGTDFAYTLRAGNDMPAQLPAPVDDDPSVRQLLSLLPMAAQMGGMATGHPFAGMAGGTALQALFSKLMG